MRKSVLAAVAALPMAALPLTAIAAETDQREQRTEFGLLECNIEGGVGFIVGSSKDMTCTFSSADGRPEQRFVGTVKKFGLDVGVTGATIMEWVVLAPTGAELSAAALEGTYVGAGAEASAVVGGGANVLVGGDSDSFALQPVSIQGQTGVNIALGVTSFELVAVN
ncbi:MAG: DUF992 domain-containing protein [Rhizobiaceae bacterium]